MEELESSLKSAFGKIWKVVKCRVTTIPTMKSLDKQKTENRAFSSDLRGLNLYFTTELRQMMSHDIVKNIYSSFNTFWMTDGYSADIIAYEIVSML